MSVRLPAALTHPEHVVVKLIRDHWKRLISARRQTADASDHQSTTLLTVTLMGEKMDAVKLDFHLLKASWMRLNFAPLRSDRRPIQPRHAEWLSVNGVKKHPSLVTWSRFVSSFQPEAAFERPPGSSHVLFLRPRPRSNNTSVWRSLVDSLDVVVSRLVGCITAGRHWTDFILKLKNMKRLHAARLLWSQSAESQRSIWKDVILSKRAKICSWIC